MFSVVALCAKSTVLLQRLTKGLWHTLRFTGLLGLGYMLAMGNAQAAQNITTLAGDGTAGFGGDGGAATSAQVNGPRGLVVDSVGNVYFADARNHRVRMVSPAGVITTVAGNGTAGYSGDGGPASSAQLNLPIGIAIDSLGNLYISDGFNHAVRKVTLAGTITTVAGNGTFGYSGDGGPATSAQLYQPWGVAVDVSSGNLYIADRLNDVVRKVTPGGVISTVAGTTNGFSGDGGPAASAQLSAPTGVATDAAGNLYIADNANSRIRMVNPAGIITTVAGDGTFGYSGDGGPSVSAQLYYPIGVFVDGANNVYIADSDNQVIRKFVSGGNITTVVGNGAYGFNGDAIPATSAQLSRPFYATVSSTGVIYIADTDANRIRYLYDAAPSSVAPVPTLSSWALLLLILLVGGAAALQQFYRR